MQVLLLPLRMRRVSSSRLIRKVLGSMRGGGVFGDSGHFEGAHYGTDYGNYVFTYWKNESEKGS